MSELPNPERPVADRPSTALEIASPGTPGQLAAVPAVAPGRLSLSHVADAYRRYPGETATFYTRVDALQPVSGFTVQIGIPSQMTAGDFAASESHGPGLPQLLALDGARYMAWTVDRAVQPGERFEYEVQATIAPTDRDLTLESQAMVLIGGDGRRQVAASQSATIAVTARGRYLTYLPALYYDDDVMGRLLMLFESFWKPVEGQIDSAAYYFDPKMTPADLLPWLASWSDLELDERWPEDRRRLLLISAAALYRKRGTREGLQHYLQIYTGEKAQIVEHSARNFRLGADAVLGPSIALGTNNQPHTMTVTLRLPPISAAGASPGAAARLEQERRRTIEAIIEAEKPAHTDYTLNIEIVKDSEARTS